MKNLKNTFVIIVLTLISFNCVQERHLKKITLKVDTSLVKLDGNIGVRGSFTENRWKDIIPLKDIDGDGIFECEIEYYTAQNSIQFKFVNSNNEFELKGLENRTINFTYKPEHIIYETSFNNQESKQTLIDN